MQTLVWFAPHDMPIGARIRPTIDESICVYDKLLLVLSEHSVGSRWVEQELETAPTKEEDAGREVLFPVRLDDAMVGIQVGWPTLVKRTRNVRDFTRWKEHYPYSKAFDRLLRDLKPGRENPPFSPHPATAKNTT
jgi:TIR domain